MQRMWQWGYEIGVEKGRPKGKWIDKGGLTRLEFECCNCGHQEPLITPFCSWCGMDMRGEE